MSRIQACRIDGIAITDHHNKEWSFEFRSLVEKHFPGEAIIIPGWEIEGRPEENSFAKYQVAELFLPYGRVFRSYCHPCYYSPEIVIERNVHGIEIDNYIHNWHIRKAQVDQIAQINRLLLLEVSDARSLDNIEVRYTDVDLVELYSRAVEVRSSP